MPDNKNNNKNVVKISIENDKVNRPAREGVLGQREETRKKPILKKKFVPKEKNVKKGGAQKKKSAANGSKKNDRNILRVSIAIIVTAIIVGGGIYAWQKTVIDASVKEVRKDARNTRLDFEQRLKILKNKLTGAETENVDLKEVNKGLEEKTKLLFGAKYEYKSEELGLFFEYPALFGKIDIAEEEGSSGKKLVGTFTDNEKLRFGAITEDYISAATSSKIELTETRGYLKKRKDYYFLSSNGEAEDYRLKPIKEIDFNRGTALLIDKNSFKEGDEESVLGAAIGGNVGALLNIQGEYAGLIFINMDFGVFPLIDFEKMINSINLIKE